MFVPVFLQSSLKQVKSGATVSEVVLPFKASSVLTALWGVFILDRIVDQPLVEPSGTSPLHFCSFSRQQTADHRQQTPQSVIATPQSTTDLMQRTAGDEKEGATISSA